MHQQLVAENCFFSKLMDHGENNPKDMIWHLKSFRPPEMNGIKID